MVQLTPHCLDHWFDFIEVVTPPKNRVGLPAQDNLDPERVPVQFGVRWSLMGRFEPELLGCLLHHFTAERRLLLCQNSHISDKRFKQLKVGLRRHIKTQQVLSARVTRRQRVAWAWAWVVELCNGLT